MGELFLGTDENVVGKGENADPAFSPFRTVFKRLRFADSKRNRQSSVKFHSVASGEFVLYFLSRLYK